VPPPVGEVDDGWDVEPVAGPTPPAGDDLAAEEAQVRDEPWGNDADAPTPEIELAADLPEDPSADDPDPVTEPLEQAEGAAGKPGSVANVVGVKFHSAGKIYEFDAGDQAYARGSEVIVETEKGTRVGIVAIASVRRPHRAGKLKRILRSPDEGDLRNRERNRERALQALVTARELARKRRLNVKVYRAEYTFGATKLLIHVSSEKRIEFREFARQLNQSLRTRVEVRQTGVRDEAKLVGGIGSCGRELCCTTFLPSFAPVSIKMAKDQGMVLNPTKVSGQCGRLKCCLVYEQDYYAAMRKGLPKLGKRVVVGERGEGRVIEVDVLRQRIRVSFGPGDFEVFPAGEVEPLFPSQPQGNPKK
jgi:cell fate regulator YaaT (PSP1 superfamily)